VRKAHLLVAVSLLLLACLPAAAQFADLRVNIPFAFQIGDQTFNKGMYTFSQETRNDRMIVQGGKTGRELISTSPLQPENPVEKEHTTLIFHRSGDKYFLYQLWTKHLGFQMPTSTAEKEIVGSGQQVSELKMNVKMR
jgi:hypothetical protein